MGFYEIEIKATNGSSYKSGKFIVMAGQSLKYTIGFGTDCNRNDVKTFEVSDAEKAEIVNQLLHESILKKEIPDYQALVRQNGAIILSTKNIQPEWVKPIENLKLMSESDIQQKADASGDFLYLSFTELNKQGECLVVSIGHDWATTRGSRNDSLSGGGFNYIYRKESGKFVRRLVSSWIR